MTCPERAFRRRHDTGEYMDRTSDSMPTPEIDREKLRAFVHKLRKGDHLRLLDRAIDLLPKTRLHALVADRARPEDLKPDSRSPKTAALITRVRAFHDASLRGDYYESFAVNARNCTERSAGTDRFIADCDRLLGLCVKHTAEGRYAEAASAFELVFAVLRHIDECLDDVVFFADEAGAWQIPVDWRTVLPAWFTSLAAVAEPEDFAANVVLAVDHHVRYDRDRYLEMAHRVATAPQRKALERSTAWR